MLMMKTQTLPRHSNFLAFMMIMSQLLRSTARSSDVFAVLATSRSSHSSSPQGHVRQRSHHHSPPPPRSDQNTAVTSWGAMERRTPTDDMVPLTADASASSYYGRFLQLGNLTTQNNEAEQCMTFFQQCFHDTTKFLSAGTCGVQAVPVDQYWCGTFCCAPRATDCCHTQEPGLTILAIFLWIVTITAVVLSLCYCCPFCHGYDALHGRGREEEAADSTQVAVVEMTPAHFRPKVHDPWGVHASQSFVDPPLPESASIKIDGTVEPEATVLQNPNDLC